MRKTKTMASSKRVLTVSGLQGDSSKLKKLRGDDDDDDNDEIMLVCDNKSFICGICFEVIDPKGGRSIAIPGCCGVQFHQVCLQRKTSTTGVRACPICNEDLPADTFMMATATINPHPASSSSSSSASSYIAPPITKPVFHVDVKWEAALKNKNRIWEHASSSFDVCFHMRGQIVHHGYTKRDISVHQKITGDNFKHLPRHRHGVSQGALAIKEEIAKNGPVVSLSYKPTNGDADQSDLPIIVGWSTIDVALNGEKSKLEVWIVRRRSTGALENQIIFGNQNLEDNVAVPIADVNKSEWQNRPFVSVEGNSGDDWQAWTSCNVTLTCPAFLKFWGELNCGAFSYTARDLIEQSPFFEIYLGTKKADSRLATLINFQLENGKFKLHAKFE